MTAARQHSETLVARLSANRASAQRIADALAEELDPESSAVSLFESLGGWTVEAAFHDPAARALIAGIVARTAGDDQARQIAFSAITPRDWVAASLEGLPPVRTGRFVIHGAHDRARVRQNEIGIEIEAALAFGTGHHGTTRGCLLAFESLRKQTSAPHRWRVLDVGTGTGVLAIAAARALHACVIASDNDPVAVSVARDNARLNKVATRIRLMVASGVEADLIRGSRYDLIFANILEAPLRRMSAPLSALLAPGGRLILSGLPPPHAPGVIAAYRRQGLRLQSRLTLDGWVTLVTRRFSLSPRGRG